MKIRIREYDINDTSAILSIWNEVIDEGESFFWKEHFSVEDVQRILKNQDKVYCAVDNDTTVGFYILHPNFPGRGNHIANALYGIKKDYRGMGIGRKLGEHSLIISKECGYRAIQFNSVVSTNLAAVHLWESLGFKRVGQIYNAFIKESGEVVEIYVYYRTL